MTATLGKRFEKSVRIRLERHVRVPLRTWHTAQAARRQWCQATPEEYDRVQQRTLNFVNSLHIPAEGRGAYSYKAGGPALLYASCYAALTLHLCGKLQQLAETERHEWAEYICGFQGDDGMFRDPRIACQFAETCDWWGWRHLTMHMLMALTALGAKPKHRFRELDQFRTAGTLQKWLKQKNWKEDTAGVSNEVQNMGVLMQYSRDFHGELVWAERMEELYSYLDSIQDPTTGLWGPGFSSAKELSYGVQAAYHFWMLYFYDHREVRHASAALVSCFRSQTRLGGFGYRLNTSACEDIDSIDPITRFVYKGVSGCYSTKTIRSVAERALWWNLANQNLDGGWVFRRHESLKYGHLLMNCDDGESSLFPTWFRLLSVARLSKILDGHPIANSKWFFLEAPGLQHWIGCH